MSFSHFKHYVSFGTNKMIKKKRFLVFLAVFLILCYSSMAALVTREIVSKVNPSETFDITFKISSAQIDSLFTLEDSLPESFIFNSWSITNTKEDLPDIQVRTIGTRHAWAFTPSADTLELVYSVTAPATLGSYEFDAVWFDPLGQSRSKVTLLVSDSECGDGTCSGDEDCENCAADCGCSTNEQCSSGTCQTFCGNGVCDGGEDENSCIEDCKVDDTPPPEETSGSGEEPNEDWPFDKEKKSDNRELFVLIGAITFVVVVSGLGFYAAKKRKELEKEGISELPGLGIAATIKAMMGKKIPTKDDDEEEEKPKEESVKNEKVMEKKPTDPSKKPKITNRYAEMLPSFDETVPLQQLPTLEEHLITQTEEDKIGKDKIEEVKQKENPQMTHTEQEEAEKVMQKLQDAVDQTKQEKLSPTEEHVQTMSQREMEEDEIDGLLDTMTQRKAKEEGKK